MANLSIPCPQCGAAIQIDRTALSAGERFSCPGCGLFIGLDIDNKLVNEEIDKLKALEKNVKNEGSRKSS